MPNVKRSRNEVQKCKFCGCTDGRPCGIGCGWIEDDLCSACQRTHHTGQLCAIADIAKFFGETTRASIPLTTLIAILAKRAEALSDAIAYLDKARADADAADEPPADVRPTGKGTRSSDAMVAGAAS